MEKKQAEEIKKLSEMVHLHVTDEAAGHFFETVDNILHFCEKLCDVDTSNVEPMFNVFEVLGEASVNFREDKVTDGGYVEEILANCQDKEDVFIAVPKVIE